MLDRERVLMKIDEMRSYLQDLKQIMPLTFDEYQQILVKRSCERLLQLSIECVIDICKIFVSTMKLGIPQEENDLFVKLFNNRIINEDTLNLLKEMRGFRNILIHEYAHIDDELVFEVLQKRSSDFEYFITNILHFIK